MQAFWERGYEATSVQDLVERMGINRFSLYSTFGGKHDLFLAALDRYRDEVVARRLQRMERSTAGLGAIRAYFRELVAFLVAAGGTKACLMMNSQVELVPHDADTAGRVQAHFERMNAAFHTALARARKNGELGSTHTPRNLAKYLTASAQGLCVMAKSGLARRELDAYVRVMLSVLTENRGR